MTGPSAPEARPLPRTRAECIRLLVAAEYDLALISPEEIAAIRAAFHLDDDAPIVERVAGIHP